MTDQELKETVDSDAPTSQPAGLSKPDIFIVQDEKGKKHFYIRIKSSDTIVELKRIPLLRYQMWVVAYQATMPKPPFIEVRLAGRNTLQRNPADKFYQLEQEAWNQGFEIEQQAYFFRHGVKSNPPDDFSCDYASLGLSADDPDDQRYAWISGLLETSEDITDMLQAIMHLFMPDENSIWEAQQHYFKSVGEWQARESVSAES